MTMRRPGRAQVVALLLVAVLILGWALLVRGKSEPAADYHPLSDGAWWAYSVEGAAFDSLVARVSAAEDQSGNPGHLYIMEVLLPETDQIWHRAIYRVDDAGVMVEELAWEEDGEEYVQAEPGYMLKTPLTEGRTWSWESGFVDSRGEVHDLLLRAEFTVEGREDVEVPAGTFEDCLKVVRDNRYRRQDEWYRVRQVLWYAPGVGLVLEEHFANGQLLGRCLLTDWNSSP